MRIRFIFIIAFLSHIVCSQKTNLITYFVDDNGISENYNVYQINKYATYFNPSVSVNFTVPINGKWGLFDRYHKEILPAIYDTIITDSPFGFIVKYENDVGVVNSKNEVVIPLEFEDINYCDIDTVALVKKDDKWCYWEKGNLVYDYVNVFYFPDKRALFQDCGKDHETLNETCADQKFQSYLRRYLNYPRRAQIESIQGVAICSVEVSPNGELFEFNIENEIHPILEKECKRIVRNMDAWVPAEHEGDKIWSKVVFPISFSLY